MFTFHYDIDLSGPPAQKVCRGGAVSIGRSEEARRPGPRRGAADRAIPALSGETGTR
ncbi:hypothetical protein GCM10010403_48330 [Glycomyces rutgersensis]|uniref:Uncharacterized protein n=1 Tax=Glycomyces rutgersensis TaxID=58115 RepID=A0ABN3GEM3_9ACTN